MKRWKKTWDELEGLMGFVEREIGMAFKMKMEGMERG